MALGCTNWVRSQLRLGLLSALPWLLSLSFLVFPMVSSAAFRAFSCEEFDTGRAFLFADYSVECSTADFTSDVVEGLNSSTATDPTGDTATEDQLFEDLPHELEPPPAAASQSACSMDAQ